MASRAVTELVAHAALLERLDAAAAHELDDLAAVADRAGAVRSRAREVRSGLDRIPLEHEELARLRLDSQGEASSAETQLEAAEARLAGLQGGRRRREDEIERARSEVSTAQGRLADAHARLERLAAREQQLRSEERDLSDQVARLVREAREVAAGIRGITRIAESARVEPGETLDDLEDWGALVRSALFVARGTLETERERIVGEANALGASVLGDSLGTSSVALIRRRLEESL